MPGLRPVVDLLGKVIDSQRKYRKNAKFVQGQIANLSGSVDRTKDAIHELRAVAEDHDWEIERVGAAASAAGEGVGHMKASMDELADSQGDLRHSLTLGLRAMLGVMQSCLLAYSHSHAFIG